MKVAVLADIHSNLPALQVVMADIEAWQPDKVIVAGDIINRGPRPVECLDLIREKQHTAGWQTVKGNHEEFVLDQDLPDAPTSGPAFEIAQSGYWTYQQLGGEVDDLAAMPFQVSLNSPDGVEARVVHASMRGNRDGIYPDTTDEKLRKQIEPPPAVFCTGHTHRPLIRTIDRTLVFNVGSVGMPFDGDHRAAYGQLTWHKGGWQAKLIRLDYDLAQAEQDFMNTGFIPDAGPLGAIMLVELRQARAHIHLWAREFQEAVLKGKIPIAQSVRDYLGRLKGEPGTDVPI